MPVGRDHPLGKRSSVSISHPADHFLTSQAQHSRSPRKQPVLIGRPTIDIRGVSAAAHPADASKSRERLPFSHRSNVPHTHIGHRSMASSSSRGSWPGRLSQDPIVLVGQSTMHAGADMLPGAGSGRGNAIDELNGAHFSTGPLRLARAKPRPPVLVGGVRKRRLSSQRVETVDLLDNSDDERPAHSDPTPVESVADPSESQAHSRPKAVSSAGRSKRLRRRIGGGDQLPPPSASLSLRARQLRMLLCGGVCDDLQTSYPVLLASFRSRALQLQTVDDRGVEQGGEGVEEVARDKVAAAAAVKRARHYLEVATRRSLVASARFRRLTHSEASASQAVARCDEDLAMIEKELASARVCRDQLRESYQLEVGHLREEYQAEILSLQHQLEHDSIGCVVSHDEGASHKESTPAPEKSSFVILPSCLAGWCNGGSSACSSQSVPSQTEGALAALLPSCLGGWCNGGASSCIVEK